MTSRAALHALIDSLPDDTLPAAEAQLRALDPEATTSANGVPRRGQNAISQDRGESFELTVADLRRLEKAAANGEPLAWALLHAEPLGPEFNSERPHDLAGRGDDWFPDDDAE